VHLPNFEDVFFGLFAKAVGIGGSSGISTSLADSQWIIGQIVWGIVFRIVGSAIGSTVSMLSVDCTLGIADEVVALVIIRTGSLLAHWLSCNIRGRNESWIPDVLPDGSCLNQAQTDDHGDHSKDDGALHVY